MIKQYLFRISFFVFTNYFSSCATEDPVIKTPLGDIKGTHIKSYEGRTVAAFEGIPYAKPPVGELRFKEPQPTDSWSDTLSANKTYVCKQYNYLAMKEESLGDEDCLYLYVYVPMENIDVDKKLDVVVHIHGGGFIMGDPKSIASPEYVMDRDLIYVSMNYRLGILGFLGTEDDVVPGNNGLKDQVLALKWIKENIQYFGGNPDSVTLTGMSAGAASVHFHYFSPLSKGLFHRGHSQSGTAIGVWVLTKNPLKNAQKLGEIFDCNTTASEKLVNCLREVPGRNITAAMYHFFTYRSVFPLNVFVPVIEPNHTKAFLTEYPYKLLMEGKFNDVPWITSNTKDEGIIPVAFFVMFHKLTEFDKLWNEILPYTIDYYNTIDEDEKASVATTVRQFYLKNESLSKDNIFDLIKLHTDRLFISCSETALRLHAKMGKSPVYYYYFDYHIHVPIFYKANLQSHGDDYLLLYRHYRNPKVFQQDDNEMRKLFLDFLFNFASKGVTEFKNVEWKPILSDDGIDYLHISSPSDIQVEHAKEIGSTSFWNFLSSKENAYLFS